ncbi:MAG: sigma 54-interacting transcriptional regulator [Deltaproteobacteria bacterium]|nr:sigma 54-interacting transcriptional regulator [Deltaproteobacteria bacterium]
MTTELTLEAGQLTKAFTEPHGNRAFLVIHVDEPGRPSWVAELADGGEVSFGRSRGATVVVDHEKVSRLHAKFRRTGERVQVEDLESRNGTRVNGERITGVHALTAGDEITIGPATIVLGAASQVARRTRVVDADVFEARVEAELDHANRYRHRVTLAALRITGDERVIEAIARSIRPMDLAADYGGDQFALLLPRLSREESEAALQRLIDEGRSLDADIRAGIAIAPDDGVTADELLERSRAALRQARTPGALVLAAPPPAASQEVVVAAPAMLRIYALVERIADSNLTVLVLGETGVGKELVAEAIHGRSGRHTGPMVKINCGSLPENLLESELFGHERGSFTGADRRKIGFFEAATGGTIFLDEIGEMTPALQVRLLRVLERRVVTRVGGTDEIAVDVRVVAATHRDVEAEVRAGRFREDLYFRLAGFTLAVPPLRVRTEDIVPIAEAFVKRVADELGQPPPVLGDDAKLALRHHDWPGNVRELRNAIERAVVVQSTGTITADDLPERVRDAGRRARPNLPEGALKEQLRDHLADLERVAIVEALETFGGNQTRTAKRLGISRRALIYKMERLGLKPPPISKG